MKTFMDENFLLETETARMLYAKAKEMPIFDFHNHLSAKEIYEDKSYQNITEVWLYGDHYKWRGMRACGTPEELVTGPASDRDRFDAWMKTVPQLIGNPLYHWTHLELKRYFGCDLVACPENADAIWELTGKKLREEGLTARKLLEMQNVELLGTTDDPADDLCWHQKLREENYTIRVLPTFRPDRALGIDKADFVEYMDKLGEAAGRKIATFDDLTEVLEERLMFFKSQGCVASDHSIEKWAFDQNVLNGVDLNALYTKRLAGEMLTDEEVGLFRSALLLKLGRVYAREGIVMQLHVGAIRNQSARMFAKLGADVGCDGMDDRSYARELTALLSALDETSELPKIVLYGLNPSMNEFLAILCGSYAQAGIRNKVQLGSAWWFCDHKKGMEDQMECFASESVLAGFVGMTTDSRSFLSFTRHEYFRRILCNLVGKWVEAGEYPYDEAFLVKLVEDISCRNAREFFA